MGTGGGGLPPGEERDRQAPEQEDMTKEKQEKVAMWIFWYFLLADAVLYAGK